MNEPLGFSVRIFVPSGEPEGLRFVEKWNWTGQGIVFPRSLFSTVRAKEVLNHTGVYVLWEPGELGQLPLAYVGEADVFSRRLEHHAKNKDFWTHVVAFLSKDQSLNKAHAKYLEARLVDLADQAKRCELTNGNVPRTPSLSPADKVDAELYLADMLLCLPVVGVNFFDKPRGEAGTRRDLLLNAKGIQARGYEAASGFVVRTDSQAVKEPVASVSSSISDLRNVLFRKGIFEDTGAKYRVVQDYPFSSLSKAASVLLGAPMNGLTAWKDGDGRTLKEIRDVEVDSAGDSVAG